ncbi:MAG: flagellar capping protein [Lachnospiraceae bacterium]|nr:flagellar capping protein [Lachnospiraceae bacterium]
MAYNAALNTVYNHYLTTYAPKGTTQYDTHKKSELRSIYNSIVKLNKEAPLYIMDTSKQSREFAVGLKENARQLRNTIASLGGLSEDEMFNKKAAYSSNENLVSASFIGEMPADGEVPSFTMEVTALASNQVNMGEFLAPNERIPLPADAYSFDITINDLSYEFQYNIHEGETNKELQERLSRLITNADIGILADIYEDNQGNTSLRLTSTATGIQDDKELLFQVSDNKTSKRAGSVAYLGIDFVSRKPANAEFYLNGEPCSAYSNHFTVDKKFELTLNGISSSEGETAEIGLKTDLDSLTENVSNLIGGYNTFMKSASEYMETHPRSKRLLNEMNHMALHYQNDMAELGLSFNESGQLSLDETTFRHTLYNDENKSSLSTIREFANALVRKTGQISLNPMEYVERTIVAYKNPGHNFVSPYTPSSYSGMMFNGYC